MKAKRDPFERETKFMPVDIADVKLDGRFSGYASLFGKVDQGNDAVMKGAFSASLRARKPSSVRMLFQHDPDQPIGVWHEIHEDQKGLYVSGQITRGVRRSEEILELMRSGAIDGLSIGFRTKRARTNPATGVRHILVADLWEISVVTFPLLTEARIETVKSTNISNRIPSIRQFERWLTRDAGLSRRDARRFLTGGYDAMTCKQDAAGLEPNHLAQTIRKATRTFRTRKYA